MGMRQCTSTTGPSTRIGSANWDGYATTRVTRPNRSFRNDTRQRFHTPLQTLLDETGTRIRQLLSPQQP